MMGVGVTGKENLWCPEVGGPVGVFPREDSALARVSGGGSNEKN